MQQKRRPVGSQCCSVQALLINWDNALHNNQHAHVGAPSGPKLHLCQHCRLLLEVQWGQLAVVVVFV